MQVEVADFHSGTMWMAEGGRQPPQCAWCESIGFTVSVDVNVLWMSVSVIGFTTSLGVIVSTLSMGVIGFGFFLQNQLVWLVYRGNKSL